MAAAADQQKRRCSPRAPAKGYNVVLATTARTDEMMKEAFGFLRELDFELAKIRFVFTFML